MEGSNEVWSFFLDNGDRSMFIASRKWISRKGQIKNKWKSGDDRGGNLLEEIGWNKNDQKNRGVGVGKEECHFIIWGSSKGGESIRRHLSDRKWRRGEKREFIANGLNFCCKIWGKILNWESRGGVGKGGLRRNEEVWKSPCGEWDSKLIREVYV